MSNRTKFKDKINQNIAPMPPEFKKKFLPYAVVKLLTGAQVFQGMAKLKKDVVSIRWNNDEELVHIEDFMIIKKVADEIYKEQVQEKNLMTSLMTIPTSFILHKEAAKKIANIIDNTFQNKKKVIFIKDTSGCGYWRFVVPARYMQHDKLYIDMAEIEVVYDYLLEYDTIVVQRLHTWAEFYTIDRLKRQGKRIVYDIDDDIFNIPNDNPASKMIHRDQYEAARAIMHTCDVVTTTTDILKQQLHCPEKTVVIPNSIDLDDGYPAQFRGSQDGFKRILWMGSATHNNDWLECIGAVDKIFQERKDVRLVILGGLPSIVKQYIDEERPSWDARIEFMDFTNVETYVATTKQLVAECAICPLNDNEFNRSKSNLKYLEYAAAGIPTIMSNVSPYKEHIVTGVNGFLANNEQEWYENITTLLDNPEKCKEIVNEAVKTVKEKFDIKKNVKAWEQVLGL